jgi:hypothetical protein
VYTPQACGPSAARAVADVPSAIAATRLTNAHAKAKELIIIFVNFVFMVVVSFCLSSVFVAFFDSSLLSCHFRPFTEVLRKILESLTQEVWESLKSADYPPSPGSYGGTQRMSRVRTVGAAVWAAL